MKRFYRMSFGMAVALVVGCSSSSEGGPAGSQPVADASEANQPVWKPTSARVELSSFGFWDGSTGYAKDRADMPQEQLDALAGLRTMAPPPGNVGADFTSYQVRVIDQDGSSVTYRAVQGNIRDSDERAAAATFVTIDYTTLVPFLGTIRCLAAKRASAEARTRTTETPNPPTADDISSAVALPADTGCTNGVFVSSACTDTFFSLDVTTPTTYAISSGRCLENLSLRAYSADGATLLAESVPGTADACFSLQHAFDPGKYVLVFSKTNAAGCSAQGGAGDASLRLQRVK